MQVWALTTGEDYEGGHTLGIYLTHEIALASAEAWIREHERFPDDPWKSQEIEGYSGDHWHSGCDWLSLQPWEVKEEADKFEPVYYCAVCREVWTPTLTDDTTVGEVLDGRCPACRAAKCCDSCVEALGPVMHGRCEACREQDRRMAMDDEAEEWLDDI
jgi:hypothetical protein